MSKLYPPIIGGILPAFYQNNSITIPYQQNRLVSQGEIKGFRAIVKSVSTGRQLCSAESDSHTDENIIFNDFGGFEFKAGTYYKIQVAYKDTEDDIGYYSDIGVIKCTCEPTLEVKCVPGISYNYMCQGIYKQEDKTEKLSSYQFDIYEDGNVLFESSGELLHNNSNDTMDGVAISNYTIKKTLQQNKNYAIVYTTTSVNGSVKSIYGESFSMPGSIQSRSGLKPHTTFNREEGYVKMTVAPLDSNMKSVIGNFLIKRTSSKNNYETSEVMYNFSINGEPVDTWSWIDCTVENGYSYIYSIQQYNSHGIYAQEEKADSEVKVNFEHSFLYDGKRQLKIKFDPKVSSFKTNILETKVDTIGGKYPTFYRNGSVAYKEFPISGLISYHSDYEKMFVDWETEESKNIQDFISKSSNRSTILSRMAQYDEVENSVVQEQRFKHSVLDWLNDGKPKLFRSSTEGNFIIRVMNVSLSPNETLGRVLHTFSATAYEMADYTYDNLVSLNLISSAVPVLSENIYFKESKILNTDELISSSPALSLDIRDVPPNTTFIAEINNEIKNIVIGATGEYHIPLSAKMKIQSLKLASLESKSTRASTAMRSGSVVFSYMGVAPTEFNTVKSINPSKKWTLGVKVGACEDLIGDIEGEYLIGKGKNALNTRKAFIRFNKFGSLRFFKRNTSNKVYCYDDKYYIKNPIYEDSTTQDELYNLDPLCLYRIIKVNTDGAEEETGNFLDLYQSNYYRIFQLGDKEKNYWSDFIDDKFYIPALEDGNVYFYSSGDTFNLAKENLYKVISAEDYNCKVFINNEERFIDLTYSNFYKAVVKDIDYSSVKIGPGVIAECLYTYTEVEYDENLLPGDYFNDCKKDYQEALSNLANITSSIDSIESEGWEEKVDRQPNIIKALAKYNQSKRAYEIALACAIFELTTGNPYQPDWTDGGV